MKNLVGKSIVYLYVQLGKELATKATDGTGVLITKRFCLLEVTGQIVLLELVHMAFMFSVFRPKLLFILKNWMV